MNALSRTPPRSRALAAILWGGVVGGVLDISDAFVFYGLRGVKPSRILQTIASGVLGVASFKSGLKSAALGAILHFFIALTAAATYYAASRKVPLLTKRPVIYGLLYGVAVYLFMNLIVVPLSAVPKFPVSTTALINGILAIMFFIGLPIAVIVRHYSE